MSERTEEIRAALLAYMRLTVIADLGEELPVIAGVLAHPVEAAIEAAFRGSHHPMDCTQCWTAALTALTGEGR
jgi:hypothetical protein